MLFLLCDAFVLLIIHTGTDKIAEINDLDNGCRQGNEGSQDQSSIHCGNDDENDTDNDHDTEGFPQFHQKIAFKIRSRIDLQLLNTFCQPISDH